MKSFLLKYAVLLATLGFLYYYNTQQLPIKTRTSIEYENWYSETRKFFVDAQKDDSRLPTINVTLENILNPDKFKLELNTEAEFNNASKVLRLLQLAQAADLFQHPYRKPASDILSLKIVTPRHSFEARFAESEISQSIQKQNLVRLFQLYASQRKTTESEDLHLALNGEPNDKPANP